MTYYHNQNIEAILQQFDVSPEKGLSHAEAKKTP